MKSFFADLHIHIGRTTAGNAVKITASRELTFANIIHECLARKGIDIIAVVDSACFGVLKDIRNLMDKGELMELEEGGLLHRDKVTVILASEVETCEPSGGSSHQIAFFPFLRQISEFSRIMSRYISNMELSSQRASLSCSQLFEVVKATGGILIPAHAFTPHKGLYGNAARRMADVFVEASLDIPAVELGLSADTDIADRIDELKETSFLSNSDAHSLGKIGREYNIFELEKATFREVVLALHRRSSRRIIANFGLDPRLGRYHRSFCTVCNFITKSDPPVLACEKCGSGGDKFVKGVLDRIVQIEDFPEPRHPSHRPPYNYQIPLEFVPGVNNSILDRLISAFGSEMAVLHSASKDELKKVVGWEIAGKIILAREGKLSLSAGGGGKYGSVVGSLKQDEQLSLL